MREKLVKQLFRDEGKVSYAYQDHLGYWTIGVGRLIDRRKGGGLSDEEIAFLLDNDISRIDAELTKRIPWFNELDEARKGVLMNMAFQMGVDGLLAFKNTLKLVQSKQWDKAADAMLQSKWAREQTPARAKRLSDQMRTGEWK